ncbi:MAG TPA: hypothetical protein VFT62_09445 [Mycobacteriales bacterium]|nr:hypothetical protein [Mycobacteriales bacterium]
MTARLHSYAFTAQTTVAARHQVRTTLTGRVVRGEGVAYRLRVGHRRTEVVRTRRATYVRKLPGQWARLAHPRAVTNPTATLLALLRGMTAVEVRGGPAGSKQVRGRIDPPTARAAGIPADGRPAEVAVTLDRHAHVTAVVVRTGTQAGRHAVTAVVHTSYRGFDHVSAIHPPV